MADVEKRYFAKPRMMHGDTKMIRRHFYETHLPPLKPVGDHGTTYKHPLPRQSKGHGSTFLPPIVHNTSSGSILANGPLVLSTTHIEATPSTTSCNSSVREAAERFILRNNMAKFSHESSSAYVTNSSYPKRTSLYNHIQAKIDTGLPRRDSTQPLETNTHQLEPIRPVNWNLLKHDIENDIHIRVDTKKIQFNSGITYATQIATLGNLVRSKVKSHLSSPTGSGDERYKIIVHLTVFPTIATGLHVASRCLWDTRTDNSITIKMQGVDCDILIVIFLCYTNLGDIST